MQKNSWLTGTTNYFYLHMLAALLNFFLISAHLVNAVPFPGTIRSFFKDQ